MTAQNQATKKPGAYVSPQESLRDMGRGGSVGHDILAQQAAFEKNLPSFDNKSGLSGRANPEFKVAFDRLSYKESHDRKDQIQNLQNTIEQIKHTLDAIKVQSAALSNELVGIERTTMEALPERVGIYHVRYFELILQYIRGIQQKIGEARTWLHAGKGKKAKMGYAAQTKKAGTSYSMSQELQVARSVG